MTRDEWPVLSDRFRIDGEVGRGGMAVVYRAYDTHLDRYVAIKVIAGQSRTSSDDERFVREIAITAKLVHPNIVALFDSGEAAGRRYYVMPLVPGESLRNKLAREQRLTLEEAASLGADIASGLACAHRAGVVHRDIKPENVFVVSGRAVIADFGIARVTPLTTRESRSPANITSEGMIVGSVAYMSPEQAAGDADIDGRSDLYSLGCLLYEMLTGRTPFTGPPLVVLNQHIESVPTPLGELNIRVSDAVDTLVSRLLAKDPADRPAGADLVEASLRGPNRHASPSVRRTSSEADRLVGEGVKAMRFGGAGGTAAKSHLEQAMIYLQNAIALDPRHARALCTLGNVYYVMGNLGLMTPAEEAHRKGRELIFEALTADDRVADVHMSLAKVALYYDDDYEGASRHVDRALALNPEDWEARRVQSIVLKIQGRTDEAIAAAEAALALAPQMPMLANSYGDALLAAGRYDEAIAALRGVVKRQPGHGPALERIEVALARKGQMDLAVDYRIARLRGEGLQERGDELARAAAQIGPIEARRADLGREVELLLGEAERSPPFAAYFTSRATGDRLIVAYSEMGDVHEAVSWIERAQAHRPSRLRRVLADLLIDRRALPTDPRYRRLLMVAGLDDLLP